MNKFCCCYIIRNYSADVCVQIANYTYRLVIFWSALCIYYLLIYSINITLQMYRLFVSNIFGAIFLWHIFSFVIFYANKENSHKKMNLVNTFFFKKSIQKSVKCVPLPTKYLAALNTIVLYKLLNLSPTSTAKSKNTLQLTRKFSSYQLLYFYVLYRFYFFPVYFYKG